MRIKLLIFLLITSSLYAEFKATISPIPPNIKQKMIGVTWHRGCPVPLNDLRYIKMTYINFFYQDRVGEMIVHKSVAKDVVDIFHKLYDMRYPINKMKPIYHYRGNDWLSIENDNTSAFNCRKLTGNRGKWSNHAYGRAIDINPIENPYISRSGRIAHKESYKFRNRNHDKRRVHDKAVLSRYDEVVRLFKSHGWIWGGDWNSIKDYQHFEKR